MPEGIADVITELSQAVQPGAVLLSAAVLEDRLEQLMLIKMRTLSNDKAKQIFRRGPLRSLAAKIDLAYAFELIDDELYQDLTVIRDIRNEFAHSITSVSFDSPEVIAHVKKFKGWSTKLDGWGFFKARVKSCLDQINAKQEQGLFAHALHGK
jgi:DNA-binding MltR family transcriptional regulator